MSLRYSDFNYNYAIQKVAKDVISGMKMGKNPMELLVKAAQAEKMTPQLVESAVHYLNNELMLEHFEKKATDKFQFINLKDVLDTLSIEDGEKTASAQVVEHMDYWDLKQKSTKSLEKVASFMVDDIAYENRKKSFEKLAALEELANKRHNETKQYDAIVKKASEIKKLKDAIYNETLLMLKRADIDPEEIQALADISEDKDIKDVYRSALLNSKLKVAEDKYKDILKKIASDGPDFESPILKRMNEFLMLKQGAIEPKTVTRGTLGIGGGLLGSSIGAAGGALIGALKDPGKDKDGKKKSRLVNAGRGLLGGGLIGGGVGHLAGDTLGKNKKIVDGADKFLKKQNIK